MIRFIIFFLLLATACNKKTTDLPYYDTADFTPIFIKNKDKVNKVITHSINDFSFKNQNNIIITNKNIENKVHIASFIFTSCGSICPTMTKNLKRIENDYGDNSSVLLLSYSVTPWIDSVPELKKYQIKH